MSLQVKCARDCSLNNPPEIRHTGSGELPPPQPMLESAQPDACYRAFALQPLPVRPNGNPTPFASTQFRAAPTAACASASASVSASSSTSSFPYAPPNSSTSSSSSSSSSFHLPPLQSSLEAQHFSLPLLNLLHTLKYIVVPFPIHSLFLFPLSFLFPSLFFVLGPLL